MANLITNGDFETNTTGWDNTASTWANSGATLTRITTDFYTGAACLDVNYTASLNQMGTNFRSMTLVANSTYLVNVAVKNISGRPVRVRFRDNNGGTVRDVSSPFVQVGTGWNVVAFCFTAGASAGASAANIISVVTDTTTAIGEFYIDAAYMDVTTGQNACGVLLG